MPTKKKPVTRRRQRRKIPLSGNSAVRKTVKDYGQARAREQSAKDRGARQERGAKSTRATRLADRALREQGRKLATNLKSALGDASKRMRPVSRHSRKSRS